MPLRPLQVGARLPGMPEYVVVGRTYTDDCITPARNIPTQRVLFVDYLRNVLANEWVAAWPSAALDAGAIAVKQYAWYTVVVERKWRDRGYPFDLIDNTCDQYYRDASADPRTDAAIQRTWTTVVTRDSRLLRMFYRDTDATCAGRRDCMGQVETAVLAGAGHSHLEILGRYFGTPGTVVSTTGDGLPERLPPVPAAPARPVATARPTKPAPRAEAAPPKPSATTAPARRRSPVPTESIEQPPSEPDAPENVTSETPIAAPTSTPTATPEPPTPTSTPEPPTPTPVPRMPDLAGLGEKQAKEALAKLGIYMVIVDYQGRDKLGERFDQLPAYTVVSHNPPAGAPAKAGMMVKLGVRGS